jgi:hypothetical protein
MMEGALGPGNKLRVTGFEALLVHPFPSVYVAEYVPGVLTVMVGVVAPVLQVKPVF